MGFVGPRGVKVGFRFLSLLIVFSLLFNSLLFNQTVWAGGSGRIAVLEVYDAEENLDLTRLVADRIRERLADGLGVVSRTETVRASLPQGGGGEDLSVILQQARERYNRLELESGQRLLEDRLARIAREGITKPEVPYLANAYILLGMFHQALGKTGRALQAFGEAAKLSPDLVLTERDYSPTIRRLFSEARQQTAGVEAEHPRIIPEPEVPVDGVAGFSVPALLQTDLVWRRGAVIGRRLGAKQVVLIFVEREGEGFKATATVIDPAQPGSLAQDNALVAERGGLLKKGTRYLAAFVSDVAGPAVEAGKLTEAKDLSPSGKPFWKKPAVWIIGGIVLAGAGAGIGIALSSGGGDATGVAVDIPIPGVRVKLGILR